MGVLPWSSALNMIGFILMLGVMPLHGALNKSEVENIVSEELKRFEERMEARYGLVRRCLLPVVDHGRAKCEGVGAVTDGDLPPRSRCSVVCDPGYIAAVGYDRTLCQKGGTWSRSLVCEVPLLLVSGGNEVGKGPSLEFVSVEKSQSCHNITIPELPREWVEERKFHNLVFVSRGGMRSTILVCNGLSQLPYSTCISWKVGERQWTLHSKPNQGSDIDEMFRKLPSMSDHTPNNKGLRIVHKGHKDFKRGRKLNDFPDRKLATYAASSVTVGDNVMLVGGMVNTKPKHKVVETIRANSGDYWSHVNTHRYGRVKHLSTPRSFFCTVPEQDNKGFYALGGFSGAMIEKSAEFVNTADRSDPEHEVEDLPGPRMGHGCTGLASDPPQYLVSGGSEEDGSPAMSSSLLFNPSTNGTKGQWRPTGPMNQARFGHALVTVGEKVLAIGGKKIHPELITDTIEEYRVSLGTWHNLPTKLVTPRTNFGFTLVPPSMFPGCEIKL